MPESGNRANKKIKLQDKVVKIAVSDGSSEDKHSGEKADKAPACNPEEIIFALDIGTRTVVGVAGVNDGDQFKILAVEVAEHKSRTMFDGQVHDIKQVAEAVSFVKRGIEKKLGFTLTQVAIAAAGRTLRTCEVKVERDIDPGKEITQELVSSMEMEAVRNAQLQLEEQALKEENIYFYCVGYSVTNYYLDGYVISNPLGHRGRKLRVDILTAFLPSIVVDSLYSVTRKAGLEVASLTLEPIAAINATIPKDLRILNLALVDVGAGTSDIAITRNGSIAAYAMIPVAGDEITEEISQQYLVDFNTAEKIKILLSSKQDTVSFTDILGKKHTIKREAVLESIKPSIEYLGEVISKKILEYNQKAPNAVFLVGGGSQIPGLTGSIARCLGISEERVVVRERNIIKNIKFRGKKLAGPESITPIGIALTASIQGGRDFFSVYLDGRKVRLFNSRNFTVADVLILSGYDAERLIGRTGRSLTFTLNGEKRIVRGEYGKAAEIFVNGKQGSLDTPVHPNDNITIIPAESGKDAEITVEALQRQYGRKKVFINGVRTEVKPEVLVNGKIAAPDVKIANNDAVVIREIKTVGKLLERNNIDTKGCVIRVNGEKSDLNRLINDSDVIECRIERVEGVEDAGSVKSVEQEVREPLRDEAVKTDKGFIVTVNGRQVALDAVKKQYIFVDIFNYIDFDIKNPQGNIVLRLNGRQAAFTDIIKPGDIIDIYWEK